MAETSVEKAKTGARTSAASRATGETCWAKTGPITATAPSRIASSAIPATMAGSALVASRRRSTTSAAPTWKSAIWIAL
jgi:hypothetical protein